MKSLNRREALMFAPLFGIGSLSANKADENSGKPNLDMQQMFVVGPYPLGNLYRDFKEKGCVIGNCFGESNGPDEDEIIKSFNECRIFVIDARVPNDKKGWSFGEDDWPKIAVEGKLYHEFKLKRGGTFGILIASLETGGTQTANSAKDSRRDFHIKIELGLIYTPRKEPLPEKFNLLMTRCIRYDIEGRMKKI